MHPVNIAIFASGSGSNAENIARRFKEHPFIRVCLILSNRNDAYVLKRAVKLKIPSIVFDRKEFLETGPILERLRRNGVQWIVLAGFLWLVPEPIVKAYPKRILNIHPALLPRFGGKGMYGARVHEAVLESGEKESGITIHYVNTEYDRGDIVFQAKCPVKASDTPDTLAEKVHRLEYRYYPEIIEKLIRESTTPRSAG